MTVITKPIKKENIFEIDDNEITFFNNKDKIDITTYVVDKIKYVCGDHKILLFDYSYSKEELLEKYKDLNNKNIKVIADVSITIEDIEHYIVDYKPEYLFIDYYKLVSTKKHLYIADKRFKYTLDKIEEYSKKYNIKFLVAVNKEY